MSGWTTIGRTEQRFYDFTALLAADVPRCQIQSLPGGVHPIAQTTEAPYHLLWNDGFLASLPGQLAGLPSLSAEFLTVLQQVQSGSGDLEDTWELRDLLAQALTQHAQSPVRWTPTAALPGYAAHTAVIARTPVLRIQGKARTVIIPIHELPDAPALCAAVDHLTVRLTYLGTPHPICLTLPSDMTLNTFHRCLSLCQLAVAEEILNDTGHDFSLAQYGELLVTHFGCQVTHHAPHHVTDLLTNWETVARTLPATWCQHHEPAGLRAHVWDLAPEHLNPRYHTPEEHAWYVAHRHQRRRLFGSRAVP